MHPSYCRVAALKVGTKSGLRGSKKECMEAIEVIVFVEWSMHVMAVILYVPGHFYFPFLKPHIFLPSLLFLYCSLDPFFNSVVFVREYMPFFPCTSCKKRDA